jgi:hypothetical protein
VAPAIITKKDASAIIAVNLIVCLIRGISFTGTVDADRVMTVSVRTRWLPMVDGLFRVEKLLNLLQQ